MRLNMKFCALALLATVLLSADGRIDISPNRIIYRSENGKYIGVSQVMQVSFSPLDPTRYFSITKSSAWVVLAGAPSREACVCDSWKLAVYPEEDWLKQQKPGTYTATFTVTASGYTAATGTIIVEVAPPPPPPPPPPLTDPRITSIVNAASFSGYHLGWGSLITIFGERLSTGTYQANQVPLPKKLGNTQVFARSEALELSYVSPTQINARLSTEHWDSDPWPIRIVADGKEARGGVDYQLWGPGIFTAGYDCPHGSTGIPCGLGATRVDQRQTQRAIATDQDWRLLTNDNPARVGKPLTLWLTGLGNPGYEGDLRFKFAALGIKLRRVPIEQDYRIAAEANLLWAGAAPGFPGLYQMNFTLPRSIVPTCGERRMEVWLDVWVNNDTSNNPSIPLYVTAAEHPCQ